MAKSRKTLSLAGVREAVRIRQRQGRTTGEAVDAIDLAEKAGVEVLFVDLGSMEGMYFADQPPRILLPSGRPMGRQAFSCAHELGHHVFGHGSKLDALVVEGATENVRGDEWIANIFAAFLLMPKTAVGGGFRRRGWNPKNPTSFEVLRVAQWLGVGYSTLVTQMALTLDMIPYTQYGRLIKESPRRIVRGALGGDLTSDAIIADELWTDRAIDLRTEMILVLPKGTRVEGTVLTSSGKAQQFDLYTASRPGRDKIHFVTGTAAYVRVARRDYCGRACFRFLSDPEFGGDAE